MITVFLNLCLLNPSVVLRIHLTHVMQRGTSLYSFDIILKCQNRSRLVQPAEFWLASGELNLSALRVSFGVLRT